MVVGGGRVAGGGGGRVDILSFATAEEEEDGVIDFGGLRGNDDHSEEEGEEGYEEDADADGEVEEEGEGEGEDRDVEPMDLGPPAQTQSTAGAQQASRKMSVGGMAVEDEEDDPLYKEMMEGLAGGDSSEESEEE